MSVSLLLDFGATRIKSALVDDKTGALSQMQSRPCTAAVREGNRFEIPLAKLTEDFLSVCREYAARADFQRIMLCSQMHGFVLVDEEEQPLTEYISWQDERVLEASAPGEKSAWELFSQEFGPIFKEVTGMRLRAGFPAVKILDFVRRKRVKYVKVLSLPEALLLAGRTLNKVHITMAAGSGCVEFDSRKPWKPMLDFFARAGGGVQVAFNEIVSGEVPAGELELAGRMIPVWTGVGDHQCAVLGAGNTLDTLSVNIGTGSQVSAVCRKAPVTADTERRHFFDLQELQTITHIPAGRVVEKLVAFYDSLTGKNGWESFNAVTLEEADRAQARFDLAFFPDAWGYRQGGGLSGLTLEGLNEKNLWASLWRSFAMQYVEAARFFEPARKSAVLSGGKLAKNPVLAEYLQDKLHLPVKIADSADETLIGLAVLARKNG